MRLGFSLQEKEIQVDEDLPNFFTTILLSQADEIVNEEKNLKMWYGIECNDPDTVQTLDEASQPKKSMMGTPWYTVLSNDEYKDEFAYIGGYVEEREKLIEDGIQLSAPIDVVEARLADHMPNCKASGIMSHEETLEEWDIHADCRIKCEQSDLVIILLNLACIPDSVIRKIPHFNEGWSKQFLSLMNDYKRNEF